MSEHTLRTLVVVTLATGMHVRGAEPVAGPRMDGRIVRLRLDNAVVADMVDYATRHSPSFRELLATVELLGRVVHVDAGNCHHRSLQACL